jgi:uncharacterized membrane protein
MSGFMLGLILYICIVPTVLIMYFMMYPRNWKMKKRIFGVNNREEFKTEGNAPYVDEIVKSHNKWATALFVVILVIATGLLFLPSLNVKMLVYCIFIYVVLVVFSIPYALGNSEMKKVKKVLGIVSEKVLYADLKTAGAVRALNRPALILANVVGLILVLVAFLCDLKVIPLDLAMFGGSFICTAIVGCIVLLNLFLLPIAFMVDNYRNEVISENSDINTNYNRAKKHIFASYILSSTWISNVTALIALLLCIVTRLEILPVILAGLYLLAIMIATAIFAKRMAALNERYVRDEAKLVEDDDDYWLLGMFYYNPNDKRLNVEKRVGVGGTINVGHPAGKVIMGISAAILIASVLSLVAVAMMMSTPIQVVDTGDAIVCHQLWDEYVIDKSEITAVEFGETKELTAIRTAGTGMDNLAKGTYVVNGEGGCKLFMNPQVGKYIKITTSKKTYYLSAGSLEETEALYEGLKTE